MSNEDGSIQVVFNGEIYNFRQLRETLEPRGHVFKSRSDTETIVHAYEEYGDDFVRRLEGMFAFALWDKRKRKLVLARDRSGKKPLFYEWNDGRCTFGSEIKALLACPWVKPRVATDQLPFFFSLGYVPAPSTMYEGVAQVPPGCQVVLQPGNIKVTRYWDLPAPPSNGVAVRPAEAVARVRELVTEAVRSRLVSDVPLGALLSGGLDSSIVVGVMSELSANPVRTFSLGFADDSSYDETGYADMAARRFGTMHTKFTVSADATSLLPKLLWHHDQPYADSSAIPTYLVSRLAREHVTVALNGDGGDEVFAGYNRFLAATIAEKMPAWVGRIGQTLTPLLPHRDGYFNLRRRAEKLFANSDGTVLSRFIDWHRIMESATTASILNPRITRGTDSVERYFSGLFDNVSTAPTLSMLLYAQFHSSLAGDINVKMDRMGMASGLETRSPLLDTALVEYVATLPPNMKVRRTTTKWVLRAAFADMLPKKLTRRPKHGFSVPLAAWFRGTLRDQFADTVLAADSRSSTYLDRAAIAFMADQHQQKVADHSHGMWAILNFEIWLRMLESGDLVSPRPDDGASVLDRSTVHQTNYA
jgi:asparagine synthase (glutamine-hydrolysing)